MNIVAQIYQVQERTTLQKLQFKKEIGEWQDYTTSNGNREITQKSTSFTIATLNVWFDAHFNKQRFKASITNLQKLDPDIIGLQECTKLFLEMLSNNEWIQSNYIASDISTNTFNGWYGVVLFVKRTNPDIEILSFMKYDFQSKMGRALIVANISINGTNISIGSSHFESGDLDEPVRKIQFERSTQILNNAANILCGDFNIVEDERESGYLKNELQWIDGFIKFEKSQENDGHTFGIYQFKPATTRRLDRVLFKNLIIESMEYFGNTPIVQNDLPDVRVFPSDHLGVFCKFTTNSK